MEGEGQRGNYRLHRRRGGRDQGAHHIIFYHIGHIAQIVTTLLPHWPHCSSSQNSLNHPRSYS